MAVFGFAKTDVSMPILLAATAAGAIMSVGSLAINYMASRSYQGCGFDQTEVSAKSYAKSFVQELKANEILLKVEDRSHAAPEAPARADGKSWAVAMQTAEASATAALTRG
jgi:hypothetical protein